MELSRKEQLTVAAIVTLFAVLAAGFSTGPIFEGPDEIEHYRFVRTMVETARLPPPTGQPRGEYHQPPLYYALLIPIDLLVPGMDFQSLNENHNPFYPGSLDALTNNNKNIYLHSSDEKFPYLASPTALAVHLMRLISVLIGIGTVLISYRIFIELWPNRPDRRLLALAVVAFWPQFLYLSGVLNNDNLLYFVVTFTLWLILRQLREGPSFRGAILLGGVLGAALLTKPFALLLGIPVGVAFLLRPRHAWRYALVTCLVMLLISGWWYIRNIILTGDPTGVEAMFVTWPSERIREGQLALTVGLKRIIPYSLTTAWARFGTGAVGVGQGLYSLFGILVALALLGTVSHTLICFLPGRKPVPLSLLQRQQTVVMTIFGLTWIGGLIYSASTAWSGNQGRYLLSGLAVWGAVISLGFDAWTARTIRWLTVWAGAITLCGIALATLLVYFLPAYQPQTLPRQIAHPLYYRYGDVAELIGVSSSELYLHPGETVEVTLYWRALQPTKTELLTYLHTVDSGLVRRNSHPGLGNLLSTDWQPGLTWAERHFLHLPNQAESQVVYPIVAGLYDPSTGKKVGATDNAGNPTQPIVIKMVVSGETNDQIVPAVQFNDEIGLTTASVDRAGELCLTWVSLAPMTSDYHVFVHVLNADGEMLAQADGMPRSGRYPTSVWQPREIVQDCRLVDVSGAWRIGVGLYELSSGSRLPVTNYNGEILPNGTIWIDVESGRIEP